MGDYAVTITCIADASLADLDRLIDALPTNAAVAFHSEDSEVSATFSLVSEDVYAASGYGGQIFTDALVAIGVTKYRVVEAHALEWECYERQLETSNFPDLVSAPEVGEILGISRQRVHQLVKDNSSFPPPIVRLGSGPLWLRTTIEAYDRSRVKKPGRPRFVS